MTTNLITSNMPRETSLHNNHQQTLIVYLPIGLGGYELCVLLFARYKIVLYNAFQILRAIITAVYGKKSKHYHNDI